MPIRHLSISPARVLLDRSLAGGRLGHAYLFTGENLDFLLTEASRLAQIVFCEKLPSISGSQIRLEGEPCGLCSPCRRVGSRQHPDVQWVRPESKIRLIGVEPIRALIHAIAMKPTEAGYKVGIVCDADRMSVSAANAFLKTLEEPPARSILILLSTIFQPVDWMLIEVGNLISGKTE